MAAHIRLMRMGKKRRPYYRIIVNDSRIQRDGDYIDNLGYYHPIEADDKIKIDMDKYNEWVSKGATPTGAVKNVVKRFRKLVLNRS